MENNEDIIMSNRHKRKYRSFHEHLEMDFARDLPENKQELKMRMFSAHYRYSKKEHIDKIPSDNQIDYAWWYLSQEYGQKEIIPPKEKRKYRRSKFNFYFRGKLYKRGQFVPKDTEERYYT